MKKTGTDIMAEWASQKEKGDLLNGKGLWKRDGRIEHGNMFSDGTVAKSYVDTSLENFGELKIAFQEGGVKHKDFACSSERTTSAGAVFCNLLA